MSALRVEKLRVVEDKVLIEDGAEKDESPFYEDVGSDVDCGVGR